MKRLRRLCGIVIAAVMAICCLNLNSTEVMAAAKSTLTINERKAPTTLTVGSSWTVTGTITSNYNITWIGGYILKSDHSTVVDKYGVKPNKKSYNLKYSAVDRNLDFNKLSIGSYYYKITAHDASGKALALIDVPFKVVSKTQTASSLKISGAGNPPTLTQGGSWTATGTITSNYNITWVGGYILASDAKSIVDSSSAKPNTKSYNLKNSVVDRNLDFNKLKPGTYYYKITAHDASGKALTLKNVKFVVKAKTQAASTLKISGSGNPPTLTEGGSWTATGTITSNYNITWVGGYILASNNKSIVDSSSAKPNSKSYNLKNSVVDRNLDFNKLKPGTYYYKITAHDASGKALTLKNVKFVVKALPKPSGVVYNGYANGKRLTDIKSKSDTSGYCKCGINHKTSGHWCCQLYANQAYYRIWGKSYVLNNANNMMSKVDGANRKLTAENLKKYLSYAPAGAVLRISPDPNGDNSGKGMGHTLIYCGMNSSGDGAYFLEGNYDGKGNTRLTNIKFSTIIKNYGSSYKYIRSITWPNGGSRL